MHQEKIFLLPLLLNFVLAGLTQSALGQTDPAVHTVQQAFENREIDRGTKVLYQLYAGLMPDRLPAEYQSGDMDRSAIKCATPFVMEFHQHRNAFSPETVREIDGMVGRTMKQMQHSHESPSGRFTIFYANSGSDAVPAVDADANTIPDYVEWVAAAADSSWRHQVQTLGFSDPVEGSTDPYPIYIEDLGAQGFYGYTSTGVNRGYVNSTYIVINSKLDHPAFIKNDDPKPDEGAVKVTVAHELKHAVQFTNSKWYGGVENGPHSTNWAEMDATLMEEMVYDNVNDYYNYITDNKSIFGDADHTVSAAYAGVSWFIYFIEDFEPRFWSTVWRHVRQRFEAEQTSTSPNYFSMPEAIETALRENYNTSYNAAFTRSHLWHFAAGTANFAPDFGFEEREKFPDPQINFQLAGQDSIAVQQSIAGLSANYIQLDSAPSIPGSIIVKVKKTEPFAGLGLLAYFNDGSSDFKTFQSNNSGIITGNTQWKWERISKLGIVVSNSSPNLKTNYTLHVTSDVPEELILNQNYPNPFREQTTIPVYLPERSTVKVKIYDITGRLVGTLINEERQAGFNPIPFDALELASGIYLVQVMAGDEVLVKKMTLIK